MGARKAKGISKIPGQLKNRGPSAKLASAALKKRALKNGLKSGAAKVEADARKSGGYGRAVVSIWDAPKGGIENSPAYKKLLTRVPVDSRGKPPPPQEREGAPIKGGFPLNKYPVNVLVDGFRAAWLPDNWAQVMKNTGPGGIYHGWMSPEGKFAYHRKNASNSGVEDICGRKLTVLDGINTVMRTVKKNAPSGADSAFLKSCLTSTERKRIAPASAFHFAIVSARRAEDESGQYDILLIEGHFKAVGVKPTWYVDAASLPAYKQLGLDAKVGGKLTPARNMALDDAKKKGKVCVQVSDDISKWTYYDIAKQDFRGETDFKKANNALLGATKHTVSPLAAAQFMLAKMRASEQKPLLGGVFPTANAAMTLGQEEIGFHHFILGDFFVAEPASPCRFDTQMTLKEDYDYTCSHIKTHGSVLRCNRMFLTVKHQSNSGGAVTNRDAAGTKEKANIAILMHKWPGVFRLNNRRKATAGTEVTMNWSGYGKEEAGKHKAKALVSKRSAVSAKKLLRKVRKTNLKKQKLDTAFPSSSMLKYTGELSKVPYINKRCKRMHLKKISAIIGTKYKHQDGSERSYGYADLKYDIAGGRLKMSKK